MGGFDTYCAICGCSMYRFDIGELEPGSLRRRRRVIARNLAALEQDDAEEESGSQSEEDGEEEADAKDADGQAERGGGGFEEGDEEEQNGEDDEGNGEEGEDEGDVHEFEENFSYDPTLVTEEGLEWLYDRCCLGINSAISGDSRAFISGQSTLCSAGAIEVLPGTDPNEPPQIANKLLFCFYSQDPSDRDTLVVFPFHNCCLRILAKVLTGAEDVAGLNKDALYDAMSLLASHHDYLDIDYGPITGQDQYWNSVPGEEFSVTNPSLAPEVTEALRKRLADDVFYLRPGSMGQVLRREPKTRDLFSRLPTEMLHHIFRLLPGEALLSLLTASWPALCATRHNLFWRGFLKKEMPWLTELWPLVDEVEQREGRELDYKAVYLWLDRVTFPRYGLDGPFLSLANRRRIWGVCEEQLAPHYFRVVHARPLDEPDSDLVERAVCRHMVLVSNQRPPFDPSAARTTLFVHTADELDTWPLDLQVFWSEGRRLSGMCAKVCTQRRVFGTDGVGMPLFRITPQGVRIPAGDRITEVEIEVASDDPSKEPTSPPSIVGINLTSSAGSRPLKWDNMGLRRRDDKATCVSSARLVVSEGARFVGVTGHIDPDTGAVQSFGLLELPSLGVQPLPPGMPPCHHRLWARSPGSSYNMGACCPGSASPSHRELRLTTSPSRVSTVPDHMIPHEALLWAKTAEELSKLERLSLYVSLNSAAGVGPRVVHGMRAEYTRRYWEPRRYVGMRRNVGQKNDPPAWPEDQVLSLEVDGPGGERIDEIAVSEAPDDDAIAVKIKTNHGRELTVGNDNGSCWHTQRAPPGESIIGLIAGFTGKTSVEGYGGLSTLLVLTERL